MRKLKDLEFVHNMTSRGLSPDHVIVAKLMKLHDTTRLKTLETINHAMTEFIENHKEELNRMAEDLDIDWRRD